jgi:hypothetical protein
MTQPAGSPTIPASPDQYQLAYQRVPGKHCFYSTVAGVLSYYRWGDFSEALVMLCSGGLTFRFSEHRRPDDVIPFFILPGSHMSERQIQQFLGVELSWHEEHDPVMAWEKTKENLHRDELQVVAADTYHLPFYPRHYLQHHTYHLVTVTGYDAQHAYVSDMLYEGPIGIEDLQKARNPYQHRVLAVSFVARPSLSAAYLRAALTQGLAAYHPPDEHSTPGSTDEQGQAFIQALTHWVVALQPEPIALSLFISQLYYQIIEQVAHPRRLFAAGLNDMVDMPELRATRELLLRFEPIADRWTAAANVLLKGCVYTQGDPASVLARATAHLEAAIKEEAEAVERLDEMVRSDC